MGVNIYPDRVSSNTLRINNKSKKTKKQSQKPIFSADKLVLMSAWIQAPKWEAQIKSQITVRSARSYSLRSKRKAADVAVLWAVERGKHHWEELLDAEEDVGLDLQRCA